MTRKVECAKVIQNAYREYHRERIERKRLLATELYELRTRCAIVIQACYRGSILRLQVARRRGLEADMLRERRDMAAVSMQALARGFLDRRRVLELSKERAAERLVHGAASTVCFPCC